MRFRQLDGACKGHTRIPGAEHGRVVGGVNVQGSPVLNEAMALQLKLKLTATDTGIVNGPDYVAMPIEYGAVSQDAVTGFTPAQPLEAGDVSTDALNAFTPAQPLQTSQVF